MSARVTAFKAFLKENQTGLIQRSSAWVKARKHTIGASEMAALTGLLLLTPQQAWYVRSSILQT